MEEVDTYPQLLEELQDMLDSMYVLDRDQGYSHEETVRRIRSDVDLLLEAAESLRDH